MDSMGSYRRFRAMMLEARRNNMGVNYTICGVPSVLSAIKMFFLFTFSCISCNRALFASDLLEKIAIQLLFLFIFFPINNYAIKL